MSGEKGAFGARELAPAIVWRKSRRCDSASCVEVATVEGGIAVRDSKDPSGPVLRFTGGEWAAFVAGVRDGDFG
jgi:hypothetical protein